MSADRRRDVLFLCTGNSARSIIAEAILNHIGASHFRAFSAGSHPKGYIHPEALRLLAAHGYDTSVLRSKTWDAFAKDTVFDIVVTVCGALSACPNFPGAPTTISWDIPDPAQGEVDAFARTHDALRSRIEMLIR
ncbi:MAG: arsenate reductase ArsC [Proteobacteria bacterium]|nr:arsenate reductase ArsC [Pseudomonadota bacterium]